MSDSTTGRTTGGLPPNVQVTFRDEAIQPELRQVAERSIATLAARSAAAVAEARAAEAELARLTDALDAPLTKLIQGDPGAAKALDELRTRRLIETGETVELRGAASSIAAAGVVTRPRRTGSPRAITQLHPPYDFSWAWHDGEAPHNVIRGTDGRVGVDARSGSISGGASGFVAAHAGVGLLLRTDSTVTAEGWSVLEPGRYFYQLSTIGIGSNATVEGGVEVTALENGQLIGVVSSRWWRRRVSANERASDQMGPLAVAVPLGDPESLFFTMQPGREYTFNVGLWVFSDRSTGIGAAGAQSLIQGTVTTIWISR